MKNSRIRSGWPLALGFLLVVLLWRSNRKEREADNTTIVANSAALAESATGQSSLSAKFRSQRSALVPEPSAEEVVAAKLKRFAQSRRDIMRAMGRAKNITVPASTSDCCG